MWRKCLFGFLMFGSGLLFADGLQSDIDQATEIITAFKEMPENGIPKSVLKNAKGLAILTVLKGGFVVSARGGSGIVVAKTKDGWSAPSGINTGGVGFGFQIGAEITDFVIVLNSQDAVDAFSKGGNITLGADVSIAAGPIGRTVEGNVMPMAAAYSYSRSEGLFAGVSLEGSVIAERKEANQAYYKKPVTARQLLSGAIPPPKEAEALYKALNTAL